VETESCAPVRSGVPPKVSATSVSCKSGGAMGTGYSATARASKTLIAGALAATAGDECQAQSLR
jgi:hypothetical protein